MSCLFILWVAYMCCSRLLIALCDYQHDALWALLLISSAPHCCSRRITRWDNYIDLSFAFWQRSDEFLSTDLSESRGSVRCVEFLNNCHPFYEGHRVLYIIRWYWVSITFIINSYHWFLSKQLLRHGLPGLWVSSSWLWICSASV